MSINNDYRIVNGYPPLIGTTGGGYCASCGAYWFGSHDCQGPSIDWSKIVSGTITVATQSGARVSYSGNKPVVVCNGQAVEVKDLDEAQSKAEQLAHQHQADAYILKPVKKIAPKREVVTTDLA